MSEHAGNLLLLLAGVAFAIFILFKRRLPLPARNPVARAAQQRIAEAQRRAADRQASPAQRAAALRDAASIALESLRHPGLAAAYARRAERLDPDHPEGLGLLATALRRASRFHALERMLWRRVASAEGDAPFAQASLHELEALYAGPLKRPEIASGLRRLRVTPKTTEAG